MRTLIYFRGRVLDDRGTPLRCRNLTAHLARKPGSVCHLVSRDETGAFSEQFSEIGHTFAPTAIEQPSVLSKTVESFKPDVVYGHTHKALPDLARLTGSGFLRVADLHGDLPAWRLERPQRPLARRVASFLREKYRERRFLGKMGACTVVSRSLAARVEAAGITAKILWGGVDLHHFSPASKQSHNGDIRLAYAGSLDAYQGLEDILAALESTLEVAPQYRLTLIGDIENYPDLRRSAEAILGDRVEFRGRLPYSEIPEVLRQADVLLIPRAASRTGLSTYPSKLSEYMALGKALLVTDFGETGHVIRHRETGLLVPPRSPDATREALLALQDSELRSRLGAAARRFAEENLAWDTVADRLLDFLAHCGAPTG